MYGVVYGLIIISSTSILLVGSTRDESCLITFLYNDFMYFAVLLDPTKKCHLLAHGFRKIISYDISKEKPMSNKELESKVEDMVEEVKTKMGELFGTYKERFDFLSSNSSMGEHMESEVTSLNNGDNDFLNDYYNFDATSSLDISNVERKWSSLFLLFQKWLEFSDPSVPVPVPPVLDPCSSLPKRTTRSTPATTTTPTTSVTRD
ncbi:hypothetical protein Tco_0715913 [Tanacetum coccineum]